MSGPSALEQAAGAMAEKRESLVQLWAGALRRVSAVSDPEAVRRCEAEVSALILALSGGDIQSLLAHDAELARSGRSLQVQAAAIRVLLPSCAGVLQGLDEDARREVLLALHDLCARRLEGLIHSEEEEGARRLAEAQDQGMKAEERAQAMARDVEALRRAEGRSRHRAEQLALLSSVTRQIAGILDPDRLMQEAASAIQSRMEHTYVAVVTLGEGGKLVGRWAGRQGVEHQTPAPLGEVRIGGVIGRALKKRSPQVVADVLRDPDYVTDVSGTRSEMVVPLLDGGVAVGALDFQSESVEGFDLDDVVAAEILAEYLVVALRNARLFTSRATGPGR